ncbi:Oidioi.mRNA.OKI2018_I69.PAR.g9050.t1.cds [Oikopleura dioica]|uniref:Oidioi.mRNA.OKI2018_I69.PAR.g9050.t1.cds n=1 Tax=Oikopleura dioica TaxID=34765 RepID=A0ABN7RMU1_OIKDI|nr:Oidioi.mRNA.OKI2018_I69.PAR.g9050.t1.cds [Oikopleura dioica]
MSEEDPPAPPKYEDLYPDLVNPGPRLADAPPPYFPGQNSRATLISGAPAEDYPVHPDLRRSVDSFTAFLEDLNHGRINIDIPEAFSREEMQEAAQQAQIERFRQDSIRSMKLGMFYLALILTTSVVPYMFPVAFVIIMVTCLTETVRNAGRQAMVYSHWVENQNNGEVI